MKATKTYWKPKFHVISFFFCFCIMILEPAAWKRMCPYVPPGNLSLHIKWFHKQPQRIFVCLLVCFSVVRVRSGLLACFTRPTRNTTRWKSSQSTIYSSINLPDSLGDRETWSDIHNREPDARKQDEAEKFFHFCSSRVRQEVQSLELLHNWNCLSKTNMWPSFYVFVSTWALSRRNFYSRQ